MRRKDPALVVAPEPVRAALEREIAAGTPRLEHAFALLSLFVTRAPLGLAFRALDAQNDRLRGTALEYLHEVIPDDLRHELWPHLVHRRVAASHPTSR